MSGCSERQPSNVNWLIKIMASHPLKESWFESPINLKWDLRAPDWVGQLALFHHFVKAWLIFFLKKKKCIAHEKCVKFNFYIILRVHVKLVCICLVLMVSAFKPTARFWAKTLCLALCWWLHFLVTRNHFAISDFISPSFKWLRTKLSKSLSWIHLPRQPIFHWLYIHLKQEFYILLK